MARALLLAALVGLVKSRERCVFVACSTYRSVLLLCLEKEGHSIFFLRRGSTSSHSVTKRGPAWPVSL